MKSLTGKKNGVFAGFKNNFPLYAMFIPGFILTFMFSYIPIFGMIIAFKKVNLRDGIFGSPWVGLDNFKMLLRNANAWIAIRNTLLYNIVFIFSGLILAVILAVLLTIVKNKRASKVYQTIYIMPHFLSMVIVAYLVYAFLNMESGVLNNAILPALFGENFKSINWYAKPGAWPWILLIVRSWKCIGYDSIVYLAAIAGIDAEMYEAATIDGASTFKKVWYITIPSIKNIMIITAILNVGKIFSADFGLFYNVSMNSGALYPTTLVINTYVYNMMTAAGTASTGLSSAASMLQSILGFIMVIATNAIVNKIDADSALF